MGPADIWAKFSPVSSTRNPGLWPNPLCPGHRQAPQVQDFLSTSIAPRNSFPANHSGVLLGAYGLVGSTTPVFQA
jgi:hypothetical protein